jgi:C-terminal processing protease CtpA/Prc
MRYTEADIEEAAGLAASRIARTEHRLTVMEMRVDDLKERHGERLTALELERELRNAAIIKAAHGAFWLLAGYVLDLRLNGGGLIHTFFGMLR